ncbi:dehydrodolichyl diphosphate synthase 2 [Dendrobium catenatum]|uniref:Alkyl transferase n=1 Tax=Dendrobium catenatum TaxID=906689 RepID=A0A2I0VJC8_9ASPA|nr:dehydrodolichyl diphosphate synthase 2 [Dendrobium catenatum]PKU63517.1 Dehydrodolichyl diphosphate synthase 2 [Dendrobium catenatum]
MIGAQQFRTHFFVPNLPNSITRPAAIRVASPPSILGTRITAVSAAGAPIAIPCGEGGDGGCKTLLLPLGLCREALPKHVAVIMDGNGRWAASKGMPAAAGHEAGCRALQGMVKLSCKWGIRVLTVFAFSSENWHRPKPEVDFLMMLFENVFKSLSGDFLREGIRICIIGDSSKLPKSLQNMATELEEITRNNSRLDLIIALSYSGRTDIVQACQKIAQKVKNGILKPEDITESRVAQELDTSCAAGYAYPDLLIRTSGELRLSNFLLWELAYTELYFAQSHWPDFGEDEYAEALLAFQKRQRRFGLRTTS